MVDHAEVMPERATGVAKAGSQARFTLWLALFLFANVFVINGLIWWLSPGGFQDTALHETWDMLHGKGGDDSWGPMAAALDYLGKPHDKPLYSGVFFDQGIKFQYPPSALFGLKAMLLFGEDRVRVYDDQPFPNCPPINDIAGWTFLLLTALSAAMLLEAGLKRTARIYAFDLWGVIRVLLVFGFTLSFYPVVKAFTLGQIQLWINSIFAVALALFVAGSRTGSGALMGLICLMKPHYALIVLWGALNREWRFAAACVLVGTVGLISSIWVFGWSNHLDYLRVLVFMSEHGESYYANQSINGLLNRIAGLSAPDQYANVNFNAFHFPPYTPWVYWGTLASSLVILATGLLRKSPPADRALSFSIAAVSLTIASPIAWEHHYGVLLPAFALVAGMLADDVRKLVLLAFSYIFVSNFIPAFNLLAETPFNFAQSYTLAGGLLFLLIMHFLLTSLQPAGRQQLNLLS